jgi:hypothetical protein
LSARLLLSLLGTVGVALAVYAVISFRSAEEGFNDFVLTDGERCSTLIRKATQDAMLLNRKGDVQTTLERMAQASTVTAIRIYNPGGTVVLSSHQEEIGRMAERTVEPCASCHQRAGPLPAPPSPGAIGPPASACCGISRSSPTRQPAPRPRAIRLRRAKACSASSTSSCRPSRCSAPCARRAAAPCGRWRASSW